MSGGIDYVKKAVMKRYWRARFSQLAPPSVMAVVRIPDLEPVDAVGCIPSLRDNPFQIVLAAKPKQSGAVAIEMPRQQNARMVLDNALQDLLPFRQRQRPRIATSCIRQSKAYNIGSPRRRSSS